MTKKPSPVSRYADGRPAPLVQPGEPRIQLNPGLPPLGSPEFITYLQKWHAAHNGVPFKLTEKGQQAIREGTVVCTPN